MPSRLRNFDQMWDAYPNPGGSAEEAKRSIGGGANASYIRNTCVLRLSRAFNYSGNEIPGRRGDEIVTVRGADRKHYALRVAEFTRYMRRKYGVADVQHTYPGDGGEIPADFRGKQGVIIFDVDSWSDATGHVDLWNGSGCRHNCYFSVAKKVMLWEVSDAPTGPTLSGSVGSRGRNRRDDVLEVQRLLAEAGYDPGPIDGIVGRKTIAAIRAFQRQFMRRPDGRVDPGGRTWLELLGG